VKAPQGEDKSKPNVYYWSEGEKRNVNDPMTDEMFM
jgi:hypothetical protein